ncbi:MAG: MMPL family transporter, partial [Planctomycetota bacterium]
NILDLQAQNLESVRYERILIDESGFSTWFCAYLVDGVDEIRATEEKIRALPEGAEAFGESRSVLDFLPKDPARLQATLTSASTVLGGLAFSSARDEVDGDALSESLDGLLDSVDDLASIALRREDGEMAKRFDGLAEKVDELVESLDVEGAKTIGAFQERWVGELQALLGSLRQALAPEPFGIDQLPESIRRRFVSKDQQRFLVYVYPKKDVNEEAYMREFVEALRRVDPEVTGAPIQVFESAWRMKEGFLLATLYSLIVTLVFLFLDLRSFGVAVLAMIPLLAGLLWLLELLPVLGMEFNLANFFALPILIGTGIDGGVHIMHRFRETGSVRDVSEATCSAVALSFLTTMASFGAMSFAEHRGLRSLGQMMVIGLLCALLASVVALPCVLRVIEKRRERRSKS